MAQGPALATSGQLMGRLVDGSWHSDYRWADPDGRFRRQPTTFADVVTADGSSGFPAEAGRYHLYVSFACPWAHRTLIARSVKGLSDAIGVTVVNPYMADEGWTFGGKPECGPDPVLGAKALYEVYVRAKSDYSGRVTVPVLYDRRRNAIVNNESRAILHILDAGFAALATRDVTLFPAGLEREVESVIDALYSTVNDGVYKAGFSTTQAAYDEAVRNLFSALDRWDEHLSRRRWLCGETFTAADICLFTTLFRFDAVYYGHFKCNLRRLVDYDSLWGFARDVYQQPGVAETCRLDHAKEHYYRSHKQINPTGIVPAGPILDFDAPHGRERLG